MKLETTAKIKYGVWGWDKMPGRHRCRVQDQIAT